MTVRVLSRDNRKCLCSLALCARADAGSLANNPRAIG
jgi:hypothetical protein